MRYILTVLVLSSKIFHLVQAELTNIEGFRVDLEKLKSPVIEPKKPSNFLRRFMPVSEIDVTSIIQGQDATDQKQFPYQAALFLKRRNEKTHSSFCGGSLIHQKVVLTAAHCLENMVEVEVCLGCMNFKNEHEKGREIFVVLRRSMIIHENWNPRTLTNDIALLILPKATSMTDVIKPLKLPVETSSTFEGKEGKVSGWGKTKSSSSGISKKLKYIYTSVVGLELCKNFYLSKYHFNIGTQHLCTSGSQGKSTCQGDSGGPLVIKSGEEYIQIGIVSFGAKDCENKEPSVYARVNHFLPWIRGKISSVQ